MGRTKHEKILQHRYNWLNAQRPKKKKIIGLKFYDKNTELTKEKKEFKRLKLSPKNYIENYKIQIYNCKAPTFSYYVNMVSPIIKKYHEPLMKQGNKVNNMDLDKFKR